MQENLAKEKKSFSRRALMSYVKMDEIFKNVNKCVSNPPKVSHF